MSDDLPLLESVLSGQADCKARVEFLAPLDPMLWDRRLIEKVFDFKYTWEIYTPKEKRQYGYYVLPVVWGDRMIGRIEPVIREGELKVNGLWLEPGIRYTRKLERALCSRLKKFGKFNGCLYTEGDLTPLAG